MPPIILQIVALFQLAAQFAPVAQKAYENLRRIFDMFFSGGLITAEQQAQLMSWADAHQAATLAGQVAPSLKVDPDPT